MTEGRAHRKAARNQPLCGWQATGSMSAMSPDDDLLGKARRLVEEAQRTVTEQKGRIMRLRTAGADTSVAEQTLLALEANLKRLQKHRDWLQGDPGRVDQTGRSSPQ